MERKSICIWSFLILGIFLLVGVTIVSKNQPLLELGFKEMITRVYASKDSAISENKKISINSYDTIYTGNYKVLRKEGNESLFDISFNKIPVNITIDENNSYIREDTIICLEANFKSKQVEILDKNHTYSIPSELSFYKEKIKQTDLDRNLEKYSPLSLTPNDFEEGDKYKFCYQANPEKDFHLKFGENSIIIIQETEVVTDSLLNNITAEGNFTHLSIDDSDDVYLKFDGAGDWVDLGEGDGVTELMTGLTVSAWVKNDLSSTGETKYIVAQYNVFQLYWSASEDFRFYVRNNSGSGGLSTSSPITDAEWRHLVGTYNGTHVQIYRNGVAQDLTPGELIGVTAAVANNVYISSYTESSSQSWNGSIDEVRIYNRSLTTSEILGIYNSGRVANNSLPSGINLTGWWKLDEGIGVSADDSSSYGNDGTLVGDTSWSTWGLGDNLIGYWNFDGDEENTPGEWVTGQVGSALRFSGTDTAPNSRVRIPYDETLNIVGNITISTWVKISSDTLGEDVIIGLTTDTDTISTTQYSLYLEASEDVNFLYRGTYLDSNVVIDDNTWHHLVAVANGTNMSLYIDNEMKASGTPGTINLETVDISIGADHYGFQPCLGIIDEVRIWNRTLSPSEIDDIYTNEFGGSTDPTMDRTGLVGEWLFEEATGRIANDTSGEGNIGEIASGGTIYDFSKYNHDGITVGDVYVNSTDCMYGDCLRLDGDRDYVDIGEPASLDGDYGNITLMGWIKFSEYDAGGIIGKSPEWSLSILQGDRVSFRHVNVGDGETRIDTNLGTGIVDDWHFVAAVYNGTHTSLYFDDSYLGGEAAPGSLGTNNADVGIGAVHGDGGSQANYFPGMLDEIMIFNTALTSTQILAIYNNQSARFVKEGTQKVRAVKVTNAITWDNGGDNRVNLTISYETLLNSNISARIGQINLSVNNTGLVLYMPFEWGSAVDISGEGNDGVMSGDVVINSSDCICGSCAQFNGTDGSIDLGDIDIAENLPTFAVSVWARLNRSRFQSPTLRVIRQRDVYEISWAGNEAFVFILYNESGNGKTANANIDLLDFDWHHYVGVYNGTGLNLYIDGVWQSDSNSHPAHGGLTNTVAYNTYIGSSVGVASFWNGTIDDVMIFNTSLTTAQVLAIYNNQSAAHQKAYYTGYQNITGNPTNFTINPEADFIFPDFKFYAGDSSYPFYTPILKGSIILETWNFTGVVADTSPPTYSDFADNASSNTRNSTDVQLNVTITDGTAIDYYRIATNNTDGNSLTNQTIIDADDSSPLTAIFNESLAWFPTTGGTFGWQVWANDTGGYASVSAMQTLTIQAISVTCDCPPSGNWDIDDGSICKPISDCNIETYKLRITDGALLIDSGINVRAGGCYVADQERLFVEDGGGLYCEG